MKDCTTTGGVKVLRTARGQVSNCVLSACLGALLWGCEAELDLSGVEAQSALPVQRADLFQAAARHGDDVVVVGGMGVVVRSADRGRNWQRAILPRNPYLVDVAACPNGRFFAIEKTDGLWFQGDDGAWARQALPEMTEPQAMTCDAENGLWVIGGFSTILHSQDAGANWVSWSLDEDLYLTSIQFLDHARAIAAGEFGTVLESDDGGASWAWVSDLPGGFYPQDIHFSDPMTGWVVGLNGTIWQTEDGGTSWRQSPSGISTPLYGITGDDEVLLAVGDNATILYRRRGSRQWTPLNGATKSRNYLRAVTSLGEDRFLVAGGGALFTVTIPGGPPAGEGVAP